MVYEAAEDSELLGVAVAKYASGRTLDLGTGSGYLADIAAEKGCLVLAVDVNKEAVQALQAKPYDVKQSNLFAHVRGKFDTIVCNPPYLPDDEETDLALHGGPKGYEYIVRVLAEAKHYLSPNGQFLFLISTLTKPAVVEKALLENAYVWRIVGREKLFMEELMVYRATLAVGVAAQLAGVGKRSIVYKVGNKAVKVSTKERAAKEASVLRTVNKKAIGPKVYKVVEDQLWMQYIVGERFDEYVLRTHDAKVVRTLFRQARVLDKLMLNKQEFTRPTKNVLVTKEQKVVLLDFERALYTKRPANVAQLGAWAERVLHIQLRDAVRAYSQKPSERSFKVLLELLSGKYLPSRSTVHERPRSGNLGKKDP